MLIIIPKQSCFCGGRDMSGGVVVPVESGLSVCGPRVVWWSQMGLYIPPHLPPSLQPVLLRSSCWMYLLFRSDFFSRHSNGNQGTKEIKTRGVTINFLSIFKFTRKHLSSVIEVSIIKIYQKYWKTPTWEKKAVEGGNQYVRIEVHISLKLFHLFPIMKAAPNPPTPKP